MMHRLNSIYSGLLLISVDFSIKFNYEMLGDAGGGEGGRGGMGGRDGWRRVLCNETAVMNYVSPL